MLKSVPRDGASTVASSAVSHFLDLADQDRKSLRAIFDDAHRMKRARVGLAKGCADPQARLDGHILAMLFEQPSTRTRISFEVAMAQLGGRAIVLQSDQMQLGRGETIADTARVLSGYCDAIMLRASRHADLLALAEHATIPVINALTDRSHPCQIMADILTIEEAVGPVTGQKVAWIGDGNNVATSWIEAAAILGFDLHLACPAELAPDPALIEAMRAAGGDIRVSDDPQAAVADAIAVNTDTWVSMGDEDRARRLRLLAPYQVTAALMAQADPRAVFLHCLPAHRGEEVSAEVIDGPQSVVFAEAENRLHIQKAILCHCLGR